MAKAKRAKRQVRRVAKVVKIAGVKWIVSPRTSLLTLRQEAVAAHGSLLARIDYLLAHIK